MVTSTYWQTAQQEHKTPLIAEPVEAAAAPTCCSKLPSCPCLNTLLTSLSSHVERVERHCFGHVCTVLPLSARFSWLLLCLFNVSDLVTDLLTTADMFLNGKYLLGGLSVVSMVTIGFLVYEAVSNVPFVNTAATAGGYLTGLTSSTVQRLCNKKTCGSVLLAVTFLSTPFYALRNIVLHRSQCGSRDAHHFSEVNCNSDRCSNVKHKVRFAVNALIMEKMWENQLQLILQLINIAPDYYSAEGEFRWDWGSVSRVVSLGFTIISLGRSCVAKDFNDSELLLERFSFYPIGKGWYTFYPQKLLLFFVHSTNIANRILTVGYIVMLVNHDFSNVAGSGGCFVDVALAAIGSANSTCNFPTKVVWVYFLYQLVLYLTSCLLYATGMFLIFRNIWAVFRYGNIITFRQPLLVVLQQRQFMMQLTNHIPGIKPITFGIKVLPSLLQSLGTAVFLAIFYVRREEGFDNLGMSVHPLVVAGIGLGIDLLHVVLTIIFVFRADPQYTKSISDDKTLDLLIKMGKIPPTIDTNCTQKSEDIIKAVVTQDDSFALYKEDLQEEIVNNCHDLQVPELHFAYLHFNFDFRLAVLPEGNDAARRVRATLLGKRKRVRVESRKYVYCWICCIRLVQCTRSKYRNVSGEAGGKEGNEDVEGIVEERDTASLTETDVNSDEYEDKNILKSESFKATSSEKTAKTAARKTMSLPVNTGLSDLLIN